MVKSTRKNYFSIKNIILKGTSAVLEYELPAGTVLYRSLSSIEIEESQAVMLGSITDLATREYLFSLAENNELDKANEILDSDGESDKVMQFPSEVNLAELFQAMINHAIHVVALSIGDFTDAFNENDLKKLDGIREFADEILRISGQNKETLEEIEDFR